MGGPTKRSALVAAIYDIHGNLPALDRTIGRVRVINAGSVGMPFGQAGADWLLLGPGVELRHTSYDLMQAAERIRDTDYPQAQDFAARYILQPPSEREMLKYFPGPKRRPVAGARE